MIRVKRWWSAAILLLGVSGCFHANPNDSLTNMPANTGFILRQSHGEAGTHNYSVFLPRDYTPSKKYPAIVFLHGIGESGSDGKACTSVGLGPVIAKRDGNFPFIVIFPQTGWDWTSDASDKIMLDALHDAQANYSIDADRIILTGMSSGGKGTWVLGARHRDVFAALVPMAGYSDTADVPLLKDMPVWALHNSGDFIVPVGGSREMVKELKDEGNINVHYQEFDQVGHDCWDKAYDSGELMTWMLGQRLSARQSQAHTPD